MPASPPTSADSPDGQAVEGTLSEMLAAQLEAVRIAGDALAAIAEGATEMAEGIRRGARLHYAAAGSSGLMALADASELPGTFGIAQNQIIVHMAGGAPLNGVMPGHTEDNAEAARLAAITVEAGDVVIVLSASGTTPYALAFAETARARQGRVIALANVAGTALSKLAHIPITLPTGPEYVEGSTRLSAGTAQKVALNMMSTQMGILLGHVHNGLMVNLRPDNIKLRRRAGDIVQRISGASRLVAERALEATGYDTKAATLVARGLTVDRALALLDQHKGFLSACLAVCDAETENQS
ncbi:N-acetylmuramic acid 6-phosphate etherase [uncultured Roseobacter sp.]|uniref:N-acetylmuramic acid 6-phosphate etherase n=1 Tax=uncultured Roseobacter sp. TaxID=114847 RepID=UPI00261CC60E|nr:N-acetylmuramic acid 6-phosphate etherase [uncultured Roseobacter sp.]